MIAPPCSNLPIGTGGRVDLYLTDMHSDMSRGVVYEEERNKSIMMWPAGGGRALRRGPARPRR